MADSPLQGQHDSGPWACNCAHIPPTMPTCRMEHLIDCPARIAAELADKDAMSRGVAEAAALIRDGDTEGLAAFCSRRSRERAEARVLRMRAAAP